MLYQKSLFETFSLINVITSLVLWWFDLVDPHLCLFQHFPVPASEPSSISAASSSSAFVGVHRERASLGIASLWLGEGVRHLVGTFQTGQRSESLVQRLGSTVQPLLVSFATQITLHSVT